MNANILDSQGESILGDIGLLFKLLKEIPKKDGMGLFNC